MKLSKLLLTSLIVPSTMITPILVTSCNEKVEFAAIAPIKNFNVDQKTFIIPINFTYSPSSNIRVQLEGTVEGLSLVDDTIKIKNNKIDLEFVVSESLTSSKEFNFNINFFSTDLSVRSTIENINVLYHYQQPEKDITIELVSPSSVETAESSCYYKIEFSKEPVDAQRVKTSCVNIQGTPGERQMSWDTEQAVERDETGKYYMNFRVWIYSRAEDLDFFYTFDLQLKFHNSLGLEQTETINGCIFTHLK